MRGSDGTPLILELPVSINQAVKVRLTGRGKQIYQLKLDQLSLKDVSKPDEEGYSYFQLLDLMAIFGEFLPRFAALDDSFVLFENDEIILIPNPIDVRSANTYTVRDESDLSPSLQPYDDHPPVSFRLRD